MRERDPGRPAARADVDDGPLEARDQLGAAQRVVEQRAARLDLSANRGQPGRGDDRGEPAVKRG
jgi:hypothetical protein